MELLVLAVCMHCMLVVCTRVTNTKMKISTRCLYASFCHRRDCHLPFPVPKFQQCSTRTRVARTRNICFVVSILAGHGTGVLHRSMSHSTRVPPATYKSTYLYFVYEPMCTVFVLIRRTTTATTSSHPCHVNAPSRGPPLRILVRQ
jgi:hypothetical protein